ncbi:hypothetical protein F4815DRAFT_467655 [Daldinia loculata]|uniref:uncharacterized protein n=1 Tax=Daldinia loculata TaxID=103429 RepID=UPI0020C4DAEF|nr:uncharacterized protein F4817DRAFT_341647 [Daldinia loculata]KAI1646027.1 hypothetical protein F4817DRAFT_341647 [Daldinia loculata]KAI2781073.1 hypothetical protein F4815DRAFT_467655 [Daldinia loculata]
MDRGSDSALFDALQGILPEQTLTLIQAHMQDPQTALRAIWQQTTTLTQKATATLSPVLAPLVQRGMQALHDSPDLVVLAFVLAAFVLVIQVISFVHRTMMYVTRLAFRLMGWALFFALLAFVCRRGPEATIRDVVVFVSKLAGYASLVKDIWWSEYQKFDAQTKRGGAPAGTRGAPSGGYTRSSNSAW